MYAYLVIDDCDNTVMAVCRNRADAEEFVLTEAYENALLHFHEYEDEYWNDIENMYNSIHSFTYYNAYIMFIFSMGLKIEKVEVY